MENQTQSGAGLASHDLFVDLVSKHGEQNGGIEDFYILDETTIGCRYGDCCIRLKSDGWHYGGISPAHPTPALAFENRAADYHSTNERGLAAAESGPNPT